MTARAERADTSREDEPEPTGPKLVTEPHPPEWWTAENTAKWQADVWAGRTEASASQREWGGKIHGQPNKPGSRATLEAPIPPKQWKLWAKTETRPIPVTFFDGVTDTKRAKLPRALPVPTDPRLLGGLYLYSAEARA